MENFIKNLDTKDILLKKKKRKPQRLYEAISKDGLKKTISKIKSKKILLAIDLSYNSGLRLEEILNLKQDDVKIKERKIFIRQGKGSKDRIGLLSNHFKENMLNLIPLRISKIAIQKSFHNATVKANVNKVIFSFKLKNGKERKKYMYHFHSLRHAFAVNQLNKGVPLNVVQILLGHSNISTTSRYLNISGEEAIKIAIEKGL